MNSPLLTWEPIDPIIHMDNLPDKTTILIKFSTRLIIGILLGMAMRVISDHQDKTIITTLDHIITRTMLDVVLITTTDNKEGVIPNHNPHIPITIIKTTITKTIATILHLILHLIVMDNNGGITHKTTLHKGQLILLQFLLYVTSFSKLSKRIKEIEQKVEVDRV